MRKKHTTRPSATRPSATRPSATRPLAASGVSRRKFMKAAGTALQGAAILSLVPAGIRSKAWAAGSDAPEKTDLTVGFIPLTDCASVVIASEMGFDKKYGIKITPSKEASWASVRDKLANNELDASHVLYGLVYGVTSSLADSPKDLAVLMTLNRNGQAITLSSQLKDAGITDGAILKAAVAKKDRDYTFAHTFPTGTHAMWVYYWLAANGINPITDVKTIVVPPPQMVANMRVGNMDGFCVGEPWNARAVIDKIGFTATTTQGIWKDHPEKVLGATAAFVKQNPNSTRALIMAVLDAARYIDAMSNRAKVAEIISAKSYVNTDKEAITGRFQGEYDDGLGAPVRKDPDYMKFFDDGAVTFPWLSDGMWFLTQHKRWGLLKADPDYLAVAKKVNQIDLYTQAATQLKIAVPKDPFRSSKLMDGVVWDGKNPAAYAAGFKIRA